MALGFSQNQGSSHTQRREQLQCKKYEIRVSLIRFRIEMHVHVTSYYNTYLENMSIKTNGARENGHVVGNCKKNGEPKVRI